MNKQMVVLTFKEPSKIAADDTYFFFRDFLIA